MPVIMDNKKEEEQWEWNLVVFCGGILSNCTEFYKYPLNTLSQETIFSSFRNSIYVL